MTKGDLTKFGVSLLSIIKLLISNLKEALLRTVIDNVTYAYIQPGEDIAIRIGDGRDVPVKAVHQSSNL